MASLHRCMFMCLSILFASLGAVPTFEALFQGHCTPNTPCHHFCFDLPDGTFECSCRSGYALDRNGYSCRGNDSGSTLPFEVDPASVLYQRESSIEIELSNNDTDSTADAQELNNVWSYRPFTENSSVSKECTRLCGEGRCVQWFENKELKERCICPFGKRGNSCQISEQIEVPLFMGDSWIEFPTLENSYLDVQLSIEFKPTVDFQNGILLYASEFSTLEGDFIAIVIRNGRAEFSFDCGSGRGLVRSSNVILTEHWNRLTVYRHKREAWMQLNNDKLAHGKSKGLFSHITFRQPLYVGGSKNYSLLNARLNVTSGFRGCVRHLAINYHIYDFRRIPIGDVNEAYDIDQCQLEFCSHSKCQHGGKCLTLDKNSPCLCPLGYIGNLCEISSTLQVPSFNGSSFLKYEFHEPLNRNHFDVEMVLYPLKPDGLFFTIVHDLDRISNYVKISLKGGHVLLEFADKNDAITIMSKHPLPMEEWTKIHVHRTDRLALVEVEKQNRVMTVSSSVIVPSFNTREFWIGGVPQSAEHTTLEEYYTGCIQKVTVNKWPVRIIEDAVSGYNTGHCNHFCSLQSCGNNGMCVPRKDSFYCQCPLGFSGSQCLHALDVGPNSIPMFLGNSYLYYDNADSKLYSLLNDVRLKFRTLAPQGLLFWIGSNRSSAFSDFFALAIVDEQVEMRYKLGGEEITLRHEINVYKNQSWHVIDVVRIGHRVSLIVDGGAVMEAGINGQVRHRNTGMYLGGLKDVAYLSSNRYHQGFIGCITDLHLASILRTDLMSSATSSVNVEICQS